MAETFYFEIIASDKSSTAELVNTSFFQQWTDFTVC